VPAWLRAAWSRLSASLALRKASLAPVASQAAHCALQIYGLHALCPEWTTLHARHSGHHRLVYVDDILIAADTHSRSTRQLQALFSGRDLGPLCFVPRRPVHARAANATLTLPAAVQSVASGHPLRPRRRQTSPPPFSPDAVLHLLTLTPADRHGAPSLAA
jgi:hypothetical protein